jgi:predicted regulator of Ras-like GTPase activity (Roadblock/LC7/MglB family)
VKPAQALADLTEISSELEAAVLAGLDGSLVATTLADDERSAAVMANALALLEGARAAADGARELTQVQAATREGCVFVVSDERHVLAAVTGADPTAGLVFYDLKTTLRSVAEEDGKPKGKRARMAAKKPSAEEGGTDA